jgi:hypothetical protein
MMAAAAPDDDSTVDGLLMISLPSRVIGIAITVPAVIAATPIATHGRMVACMILPLTESI